MRHKIFWFPRQHYTYIPIILADEKTESSERCAVYTQDIYIYIYIYITCII